MNRYPVWKYAILVVALLVGVLYTLPNFFGEAPAVQVSSAKATVKVDAAVMQRVEESLRSAGLSPDYVSLELAPGVEVQLQRSAVVQVLPKGTIKQ